MSRIVRSILTMLGVYLCGCDSTGNPASTTKPILFIEGINLGTKERQALMANVQHGDAEAALTLGYHFGLVADNEELARYWFKKAAALGGKKEKDIYNSFIE